jgi:lysophospholipid acyltransferase (LPLAT)-like uncharacterized protein
MICPEGLVLKLPNYENAVISETKITGYLLSTKHRDGRSKAEFFTRLGFLKLVGSDQNKSLSLCGNSEKKEALFRLRMAILGLKLPP